MHYEPLSNSYLNAMHLRVAAGVFVPAGNPRMISDKDPQHSYSPTRNDQPIRNSKSLIGNDGHFLLNNEVGESEPPSKAGDSDIRPAIIGSKIHLRDLPLR